MALACVASLSLVSCGDDDDDPKPDDTETSTSGSGSSTTTNPMVGKTISCVKKSSTETQKMDTDFRITFNSATKFTWVMKQKVQFYDLGTKSWVTHLDLDKTETGTYTYTPTKITLYYEDGGYHGLVKTTEGWADYEGSYYVYK